MPKISEVLNFITNKIRLPFVVFAIFSMTTAISSNRSRLLSDSDRMGARKGSLRLTSSYGPLTLTIFQKSRIISKNSIVQCASSPMSVCAFKAAIVFSKYFTTDLTRSLKPVLSPFKERHVQNGFEPCIKVVRQCDWSLQLTIIHCAKFLVVL